MICSMLLMVGLVLAFQSQDLPGFVRAGDIKAEFGYDPPNLGDQVGIAFGQLTFGQVKVIFQAYPHGTAHNDSDRPQIELMSANGKHRENVVIAEKLVGGFFMKTRFSTDGWIAPWMPRIN